MKSPNALIYDLAANAELRERFCTSPSDVLREYGFNPDIFEMPESLDAGQIKSKLNQILAGDLPNAEEIGEVADMSAQELWEKLLVMRADQDSAVEDQKTVGDILNASIAPTVISAYGVGPISTVITESNVGGVGTQTGGPDWEQLRELENVAPQDIEISISGPDGKSVSGLAPHVAAAFIKRLLKNHSS